MKQWMKKGLAACLALVMCLSLAACGGKEDETPAVSYTHLTLPTICSV